MPETLSTQKGTFRTGQSERHNQAPVHKDGTFRTGLSARHARTLSTQKGTFRTGLSAPMPLTTRKEPFSQDYLHIMPQPLRPYL
jgi:hypothetical protein